MSFQPDFKIKGRGNLIEINDGAAVTFYPKDFSKTLKSIIAKIKQQPDLLIGDEDLEYHRQNIEAQLLQIYNEFGDEAEKPSAHKKYGKIDNQNRLHVIFSVSMGAYGKIRHMIKILVRLQTLVSILGLGLQSKQNWLKCSLK